MRILNEIKNSFEDSTSTQVQNSRTARENVRGELEVSPQALQKASHSKRSSPKHPCDVRSRAVTLKIALRHQLPSVRLCGAECVVVVIVPFNDPFR